MTITKDYWDKLRLRIPAVRGLPDFVKDAFATSFDDAAATARASVPEGESGMTVESKPVTEDYLDFLAEQIDLNARGEEWTVRLKHRLAALQPYRGQNLVFFTFATPKQWSYLRATPEGEVVHWEIFDKQ